MWEPDRLLPKTRIRRQILLWVFIYGTLFGARIGWLYYERSRPLPPPRYALPRLAKVHPDYLVVVPKFHINDLKGAQALIGRSLWVKAGYKACYFPFNGQRIMKESPGGQLFEPLERFIVDRVLDLSCSHERGLFLIFQKDGQQWAMQAAIRGADSDYEFQLDDLFLPQDPRTLYDHWSPEIWDLVARHQITKGMSIVQVSYALGVGDLVALGASSTQFYSFHRCPGGSPGLTRVEFVGGQVRNFEVGSLVGHPKAQPVLF